MKTLYSTLDWENAKSLDLLPLECLQCGKTFFHRKNHIQVVLKNVNKNVNKNRTMDCCCKQCAAIKRFPAFIVKCSQCGIDFKKNENQIKKYKNHFCSRSCAATYNNTHKTKGTRRSKLEVWIESQLSDRYVNFEIKYNDKIAIESELDIYIPSLKLGFELNGIFHYEPIYGNEKLSSIQKNDMGKFQKCILHNINLCIIDVSSLIHFKQDKAKKFFDIITAIIDKNLEQMKGLEPST